MTKLIRRLVSEEEGQGMVEYGLIIALVAIVAIAFFPAITNGLNTLFTKIGTELSKSR